MIQANSVRLCKDSKEMVFAYFLFSAALFAFAVDISVDD